MKKNFILLALFVISVGLFSCQKGIEDAPGMPGTTTPGGSGGGTTNTGDIVGSWKFVSLHAKTLVSVELGTGGVSLKTITSSDYTTQNNSGTIVIDAQKLSYSNLTYDVNSRAYAKLYSGGVLLDTFSMPLNLSMPAISANAAYTRIGSDSLYFQAGNIFMANNTTQAARAGGVKLKREQNTLYLTQNVDEITTITEQGQTAVSHQQAVVTITLQR